MDMQLPLPLLDRLSHAWRVNSFDTRGPNAEMLTLLGATVKALLDAASNHDARVAALEANAAPVAAAAAVVAKCEESAARLSEANRRIDFLWASQGLSTLELQQSQPHASTSRSTRANEQSMSYAAAAAVPPPVPHSSSYDDAINLTADERLDAATVALRQSIQNQQLLSRVASGGAHDRDWQAALDQRLSATEDVIDGVFAVAKQLQAQAQRMAVEVDKVNRFALSLEARVAVNGTSLARVAEQHEATEGKLQREIDTLKRKLDDADQAITRVDESWRNVASNEMPSLRGELATLRGLIPTPASVKSLVAKANAERDAATKQAALTAEQFHADLRALSLARDALFALLDVRQKDAVTTLQQQQQDAAPSNVDAQQQQQLQQRWLALAHRGLPFKSIIVGLQELRGRVDSVVQEIATQQSTFKQQMMTVIAASTTPAATASPGSMYAKPSAAAPSSTGSAPTAAPVTSSSAVTTKRPLGLRLKDGTAPSSRGSAAGGEPCCVVAEVLRDSLAEGLGFTAGLLITGVADRRVGSRTQFEEAWRAATAAAAVQRTSSPRTVTVHVVDPTIGVTTAVDVPC